MHATHEWQLKDAQGTRRELNVGDYLTAISSQRRLVAAVVCLFLVLATIARFVLPQQYEGVVVMVATPPDDNFQSNMSGALTGLNFLTGISGSNDRKAIAVATLQGRAFLEDFIRKQKLMPILFANEWDWNSRTWKIPEPPTLEDGYIKLTSAITVDAPPTESIIKLRIRWTDAKTAAMIANDLVRTLNSQFQIKAIGEARRMVDSLTKSYPETSIADVRMSIANLIQQQINQRIIAQSRDQYAMTIVDPAEPSKKKVSPGLTILLPLGLFLGLLVGIPAAFLAETRKTRWRGPLAILAPRT